MILPPSYVALLKLQNGGLVRRTLFIDDNGEEHRLAAIGGIGEEQCGRFDILAPVGFQDDIARMFC